VVAVSLALLLDILFVGFTLSMLRGCGEDGPGYLCGISPVVEDAEIGWVSAPLVSSDCRWYDVDGKPYTLRVTTDENGFRRFDRFPGKKNLIIVGDSFTQDLASGDDDTFAAALGRALPSYNIISYGAGGYGTFQEYLILRRFAGSVPRPDIVLVQGYYNDIINNSFALMDGATSHVSGARQPFLTPEGDIAFGTPRRGEARPDSVADALSKGVTVRYRLNRPLGSSEYREAVAVTERSFTLLRTVFPEARWFFFVANGPFDGMEDGDVLEGDIIAAAARAGLTVLPTRGRLEDPAVHASPAFHPAGDSTHWAPAGNAHLAGVIAKELEKFGVH
jgi:hypothetical protein